MEPLSFLSLSLQWCKWHAGHIHSLRKQNLHFVYNQDRLFFLRKKILISSPALGCVNISGNPLFPIRRGILLLRSKFFLLMGL